MNPAKAGVKSKKLTNDTVSKKDESFKNISDSEWAQKLTPKQFEVCRKGGTESPGSGVYNKFYNNGTYSCVCCGSKLFSSGTKFDSGSGWPSFYGGIPEALKTREDTAHGMVRTEVLCSKCGAHLGHVFDDGPPPTGQRFCINSVCLNFQPSEKKTE